jgi:hypothetical protein
MGTCYLGGTYPLGYCVCDVGQLQFYIEERDLLARNFATVEAQMEGG